MVLEENRHIHHLSPLRDDEELSPHQTAGRSLTRGQLLRYLGYVFLVERMYIGFTGVLRNLCYLGIFVGFVILFGLVGSKSFIGSR